jgi:hypothetical protein
VLAGRRLPGLAKEQRSTLASAFSRPRSGGRRGWGRLLGGLLRKSGSNDCERN